MAHRPQPGPDLRLFEEWMEITKWLMDRTQRFPKRVRHSLSTRVENLALGILEEITAAAYRKKRLGLLKRADEKLGKIKVLMRLSHEMKILSHGQYEEISIRLVESGKMVGAWIKKEKAGNQ